jgi:hypothetical protein
MRPVTLSVRAIERGVGELREQSRSGAPPVLFFPDRENVKKTPNLLDLAPPDALIFILRLAHALI